MNLRSILGLLATGTPEGACKAVKTRGDQPGSKCDGESGIVPEPRDTSQFSLGWHLENLADDFKKFLKKEKLPRSSGEASGMVRGWTTYSPGIAISVGQRWEKGRAAQKSGGRPSALVVTFRSGSSTTGKVGSQSTARWKDSVRRFFQGRDAEIDESAEYEWLVKPKKGTYKVT